VRRGRQTNTAQCKKSPKNPDSDSFLKSWLVAKPDKCFAHMER
jgi:hypothetical protein